MACELGQAMISDIRVREAWQRNCGLKQVRSWVTVIETVLKAGGVAEVLRRPCPLSSVALGDCVWEPCTHRYQIPWMLKFFM